MAPVLCNRMTKRGRPCKNVPLEGSRRCRVHQAAGGRPTKLSATLVEVLCESLAAGHFIETACGHAGITRVTFYDWLRKGRAKNPAPEFVEFAEAIEDAQAQGEYAFATVMVQAAMGGDVSSAKWMLERRWPHRYGPKARLRDELEDMRGMLDPQHAAPAAPPADGDAPEQPAEVEAEPVEMSLFDELAARRVAKGHR